MTIDLLHNKIVAATVTDGFVRSVNDNLLPKLRERYGESLLGIQMYEDYIGDGFIKDGYQYYPLTVNIGGVYAVLWIRWDISNKAHFRGGVPFAYIGGENIDFIIAEDVPIAFSRAIEQRSTAFEGGCVKLTVSTDSQDPTVLVGKYSQTFVDEMARQLTAEISRACGIEGLENSSIELHLFFGQSSYMEHTSENVTYRRLLISAKGCAPRDFWVKWTRLNSSVAYCVCDNVTADDILFEIGEDVSHKVREKEYRFLVYGNSDKYRVAMGRKNITEWRELIKRSVKRGELLKTTAVLELENHATELSDKLSEILEKCGVSVPDVVDSTEPSRVDIANEALRMAVLGEGIAEDEAESAAAPEAEAETEAEAEPEAQESVIDVAEEIEEENVIEAEAEAAPEASGAQEFDFDDEPEQIEFTLPENGLELDSVNEGEEVDDEAYMRSIMSVSEPEEDEVEEEIEDAEAEAEADAEVEAEAEEEIEAEAEVEAEEEIEAEAEIEEAEAEEEIEAEAEIEEAEAEEEIEAEAEIEEAEAEEEIEAEAEVEAEAEEEIEEVEAEAEDDAEDEAEDDAEDDEDYEDELDEARELLVRAGAEIERLQAELEKRDAALENERMLREDAEKYLKFERANSTDLRTEIERGKTLAEEADARADSEVDARRLAEAEAGRLRAEVAIVAEDNARLREELEALKEALSAAEQRCRESENALAEQKLLYDREKIREKDLFAEAARQAKEEREREAREAARQEAIRMQNEAREEVERLYRMKNETEPSDLTEPEDAASATEQSDDYATPAAINDNDERETFPEAHVNAEAEPIALTEEQLREAAIEKAREQRLRMEAEARAEVDSKPMFASYTPRFTEAEGASVDNSNASAEEVIEVAEPIVAPAEESAAPIAAPDEKYTYVSRLVRILFRTAVDPNITTRLHEMIALALTQFNKESVYMKVKAGIQDSTTVVLNFVKFPEEEEKLLIDIIHYLGNSDLGISKIILE